MNSSTLKVILTCGLLYCFSSSYATFSIQQTSVSINAGSGSVAYAGSSNPDGLPALNNAYLGRFNSASSLQITGSFVRILLGGASTTCNGTIYYRVTRQGATPGSFSSISLSTLVNVSATVKRWEPSTTPSINLLNSIVQPGVYVLETYWTAVGHDTNSSCTTTYTQDNAANYFDAYFEYSLADGFSDSNFTTNPVWTGTNGEFIVAATSDVTTTSATNSNTLRLNANGGGPSYLSTPISNWNTEQTWAFWIGRRNQRYSNTNSVDIWLYANAADLTAGSIDGYRIRIGDNSGADELRLQSVTNNAPTNIIVSSTGIANNILDMGVAVKVTRTASGLWTLYTSPLPTVDGSGVNANANVFNVTTVLQGSATNNTYVPSGAGFFGVLADYSNNTNAQTAFEFDNFYFSSAPIINCPAAQTLTLSSSGTGVLPNYTSLATLTSNCNCNGPVTITQSPVAGSIIAGGTTTVVTLTATDANGNKTTCSFNVTALDNTPPSMVCPANITVTPTPGNCAAQVNYTLAMTDNISVGPCAPPTLAGFTLLGVLNGHSYFKSTTSALWPAANAAAIATGGHLVTISSAAENSFLSTAGLCWTGFNDATTEGTWVWSNGESVLYTNWTAGEPNNSGNQDYGVINFSGAQWDDQGTTTTVVNPYIVEFDCSYNLVSGQASGSNFPIGSSNITYTVTDGAGNTSTPCTFSITVTDNTPPVMSCPSNVTVAASSGSCGANVTFNAPIVSDNCSTCASAPAIAGYTTLGIYQGAAYYISSAATTFAGAKTASNAAGGSLVSIGSAGENNFIRTTANSFGIGSYIIGLTDEITEGTFLWSNGQPITYTNWNAGEPNNNGNEDFVLVLNSGFWNDFNGSLVYVMKKSCITPTQTAGLTSGALFPIGTTTVSYQAADASGNISTCSFTITVTDNIAPAVVCPAAQNITTDSNCNATLPDYRSMATISDNCTATAALIITQTPAAGTIVNGSGIQLITITATDASGNTGSCSFNLNRIDATPPVITCPANLAAVAATGTCGAVVNYTSPVATDNCTTCSTPPTLAGFTNIGTSNGTFYYISTSATSYSAAQAACATAGGFLACINSTAENTFIRTVANTAGVGNYMIGFTDQTTEGTFVWANGQAVTFTNWAAGEPNNSGNEDFTQVYTNGFWNDFNGNSFYILELPCLAVNLTSGFSSGSVFPIGTTTVSHSVSDNAGNTSNCSFTVTVTDNVAPVITCPANITLPATTGTCARTVTYATPTASDNCGNCVSPPTFTGFNLIGQNTGTAYYISTAAATYAAAVTACNAAGGYLATINSSTENTWLRTTANGQGIGTYMIGLTDQVTEGTFVWANGEPVAYTNWNAGEPNNSGNEDFTQVFTNGLWNDIAANGIYVMELPCLPVTRTAGLASGSSFPVGTTVVTHSATDASGNTSVCSFTVSITDNVAPVITPPATQTLSIGAGCTAILPDYRSLATRSDNCTPTASITVTQSPAIGTSIPNAGTTIITLTATDGSGNSSSTTFNVNRVDNTGPTLVCPPTQTIAVNSSCNALMPDYRSLVSKSDNCTPSASIVLTQSPAPGSNLSGTGTTIVTITGVDASSNSSVCTFTLNRVDNTAPFISCPPTQTVVLNNSCLAVILDYRSLASVSDNCTASGSVTVTQSPIAGTTVTGPGTTVITHTATDASGNSTSCTFNLIRIDNTPPAISCIGNQTILAGVSGTVALPDYRSMVTVLDNCSANGSMTVSQSPVQGTLVSPGATIVTLSVSDAYGNSNTCTFTVNVISQTIVQMLSSTGIWNESDGTITLPVGIINPSSTAATTVQVALTSGSATGINNYTTQTLTFPAGSSASQSVTINITDNTNCDGDGSYTLSLQNISGGSSSIIGAQSAHVMTVTDDDLVSELLFQDNIEDGNITDWIQPNANEWLASNVSPNGGVYSIRHKNTGTSGQTCIAMDLDQRLLDGSSTTWRFTANHFGVDPSNTDKFFFYLGADNRNLISAVSGYAVIVNPSSAVDPDIIKLVRFANGSIANIIVTSTIDWNASHNEMGFEITRDENAQWTLKVDTNGDFDNLVTQGTGTDNTIKEIGHFGVFYRFDSNSSGKLSIDDISVSQTACPQDWYSVNTGNTSGPIWSLNPNGTGQLGNISIRDNFIIQAGHTVTLNDRFVSNDLDIQPGATLNLGDKEYYIHGNANISGTLNSNTGTLRFKGSADQFITSTADLQLNNVVIDNDGMTVSLPSNHETFIKENAVVTIPEGILQTNGKLTLKSTASGTAAIGRIDNAGSLAGNITLQRFIPALTNYPYGSWVGLGCPLAGSTINDWNDDIITSGIVGSDFPPPYPFINIQSYDETQPGTVDAGYVPMTAMNEVLDPKKGYMVYMQTPSQAIDVTGQIFQHGFTEPLSYTNTGGTGDGWNMLVNQYPSPINFRQMVQNSAGVNTYYIFDSETNNYKFYNGLTNSGNAPMMINSSQTFFVRATGPGAYLRYTEDYKGVATSGFERSDESNAYISLGIQSFNGTSDECLIIFDETTNESFDEEHDSKKLISPNEHSVECSVMLADSSRLSIDSRPYAHEATDIYIHTKMPDSGQYELLFHEVNNLPPGSCLVLEDLLTGETLPIAVGESLLVQTEEAYNGIRFVIHTKPMVAPTSENITCFRADNGSIDVEANAGEWNVSVVDANGNVTSSTTNYHFDELTAGEYTVLVAPLNEHCSSITSVVTIEEPSQEKLELISEKIDDCNLSSNGELEIELVNSPSYSYYVSSSEGQVAVNDNASGVLFLDQLKGDVYTIIAHSECSVDTLTVSLMDPLAVTVSILSDDIELSLNNTNNTAVAIEQRNTHATHFTWSLDNGLTSNDEIFFHNFEEPGDFTLMLKASNETCSAADFIHVSVNDEVKIVDLQPQAYVSMLQRQEALDFTIHQLNSGEVEARIYDLAGNLVWNLTLGETSVRTFSAPTNQFASGIYTVIVTVDERPILSTKVYR